MLHRRQSDDGLSRGTLRLRAAGKSPIINVNVKINGQIATTTLIRSFTNSNPQRLEGLTFFPCRKARKLTSSVWKSADAQVEAELLAADKAAPFQDIVRKLRDPALLRNAGRTFSKCAFFPSSQTAQTHQALLFTGAPVGLGLVSYVYPLNTEKFSAKRSKA